MKAFHIIRIAAALAAAVIWEKAQAEAEPATPATTESVEAKHGNAGGEGGMREKWMERMRARNPGGLGMGAAMGMGMTERIVGNPKLVKELGLTDDQMAKLNAALEDFRLKTKELQGQQEDSGMDQAKMLSDTNVNEQAIMEAIERAGKARTEMAKLRIKQLFVLKNTLTPDQIAKIREIVRQRVKEKMVEPGNVDRKNRLEQWRERREKKGFDLGKDAEGKVEMPATNALVTPAVAP
jgi:Spy/CpxP family protein refolding chaperone